LRETLVSFRVDAALIRELEGVAETRHYMDLSELIRAVIRKRFLSARYPVAHELERIKDELKAEIRRDRDG
jgi:metal-responsive CopG/Arc/MetJ family transcriptional regulator